MTLLHLVARTLEVDCGVIFVKNMATPIKYASRVGKNSGHPDMHKRWSNNMKNTEINQKILLSFPRFRLRHLQKPTPLLIHAATL